MSTHTMTPAPPTPATPLWLAANLRDPATRYQLRQALHEAVHMKAGPLVELLEDVLADGGLRLEETDTSDVTRG